MYQNAVISTKTIGRINEDVSITADRLRAAGFNVHSEYVSPGDFFKNSVASNGIPIGAVRLYRSGTRLKFDFSEINVSAFTAAVKAACDGCIGPALDHVEEARVAVLGLAAPVDACLAVTGSPKAQRFGFVVYRDGVMLRSGSGQTELSSYTAEYVAAAEVLEWCEAEGIERLAIRASAHVGKTACGLFRAKTHEAKRFMSALQRGPRVDWALLDKSSYVYSEAKKYADGCAYGY